VVTIDGNFDVTCGVGKRARNKERYKDWRALSICFDEYLRIGYAPRVACWSLSFAVLQVSRIDIQVDKAPSAPSMPRVNTEGRHFQPAELTMLWKGRNCMLKLETLLKMKLVVHESNP
jgi:hypothetical protein